jgi:ribonucleotide monophosphatase NagD (HAD superfamily)
MGLPDGSSLQDWAPDLRSWHDLGLPIYCSNPDRQSPRADGLVISPGALAFAYKDMGGDATFYGKPHMPVFKALENRFGAGRYLMVGDSMEHDIAGAHMAGWDSLLIECGLYAERFRHGDGNRVVAEIATEKNCKPPTYRIEGLR